ncbi:MAG TPA: hypothetical protein VIM11_17825 [Tepidisphaeraceae bacterium]|jgi:hypothetical protein
MLELEQISSRTTCYCYDSSSKRLSTITVNGTTFTFNYYTDSNQINSVVATVSGGANLTTTYLRDSADKSRINRVGVGGSLGEIFSDAVGGFNQQDQITSRTITRRDANDDGTLANSQAIASSYGYNPSLADALTSVSTTVNGVASTGYTYGFDNVGNFTGNSKRDGSEFPLQIQSRPVRFRIRETSTVTSTIFDIHGETSTVTSTVTSTILTIKLKR